MAAKKQTVKADEAVEDSSRGRDESRSERDTSRVSSFKARQGDRVPLGGYDQKLAVAGKQDGYVYRWVNHRSERVQQALNAGYIPVYKDGTLGDIEVSGGDLAHEDEWVSKPVGDMEHGKLIAYLMAIKQEWYDENQAIKNAPMELFDQAIQEGKSFDPKGNLVSDEHTYSESSVKSGLDLKR